MTRDWTDQEVELIVSDYFEMLKKELMGQEYVKAYHRRSLMPQLNSRSESSIEYKYQNISAAVLKFGIPYVSGYKPAKNYQKKLHLAIEKYLLSNPDLRLVLNHDFETDPIVDIPSEEELLDALVETPDFDNTPDEHYLPEPFLPYKRNYLIRESQNQKLGLIGEEFILRYERVQLKFLGKDNLSDKVEHVAHERGDGAGFDILSFDLSGKDKYIEVKSTKHGYNTPFYFTANELAFSLKNSDQFFVYRVFGMRREPKFFVLQGSFDQVSFYRATQYIGWPK